MVVYTILDGDGRVWKTFSDEKKANAYILEKNKILENNLRVSRLEVR